MSSIPKSLAAKNLKSSYFAIRNSGLVYKYFINFTSVINWIFNRRKFRALNSPVVQRILRDLNSNGIAFSTLDEIFPEKKFLESMKNWVYVNEKNLVPKLKKKFLLSYFGRGDNIVEIDLENPFFKFYLSSEIIYLVSFYLGYIPQLNYILVEKTIPIEKESTSRESQNWHRDPEEKKTLKVFIYLNEVTENNGPFIYVKKSQPSLKGFYSRLAPQKLPEGSYPEESLITTEVNNEDKVTAVGTAGTVIFCDTAGLHRGGLSFSGERIMSTGFYPSSRFSEKPYFKGSNNFDRRKLSKLARQVMKKI